MAMTSDELAGLLGQLDVKFEKRSDGRFVTGWRTENYVNPDGHRGVMLVVELHEDGEYVTVYAPMAYRAAGPHLDAFLKACMIVQWRTKLVQFEYDEQDGEIRPVVEFPLEDARLTAKQLHRCMGGLIGLIEAHHTALKRALEEGVIDLPGPAASEPTPQVAMRTLLAAMKANPGADPARIKQIEEMLAELVPGAAPTGPPTAL